MFVFTANVLPNTTTISLLLISFLLYRRSDNTKTKFACTSQLGLDCCINESTLTSYRHAHFIVISDSAVCMEPCIEHFIVTDLKLQTHAEAFENALKYPSLLNGNCLVHGSTYILSDGQVCN